jgi:glycosyltransferase involved in cell wall biosynthesis
MQAMKIDLIFITYNRLEYTRLALNSVLANPSENFSLTIWDNASTDGTVAYLKNQVKDHRIARVVFSRENVGQIAAVNQVWRESKADLLGKLDNDCIVTPGWTRTLARAHADIPELGVVACWHFFPEDFDYQRAKHKIQQIGPHRILRHPWTCGTGLLIKRASYERFGPLTGGATTEYWLEMARAGFVNGFYYPLIYQEHMDDPRSRHNRLRAMPFAEAFRYSPSAGSQALRDIESYKHLHERIIDNLLSGPCDPAYYSERRKRWPGRWLRTLVRTWRGKVALRSRAL